MLFQNIATFIAGFVVGFTNGWKLTLVILSVSPLIAVAGGVSGKVGGSPMFCFITGSISLSYFVH